MMVLTSRFNDSFLGFNFAFSRGSETFTSKIMSNNIHSVRFTDFDADFLILHVSFWILQVFLTDGNFFLIIANKIGL